MNKQKTGISNRESADEEARERQEHPPISIDPPPAENEPGDIEDRPADLPGTQMSHKAGSRSLAQKRDGSKYADRSMPASHNVPGAFGKERRNTDSTDES